MAYKIVIKKRFIHSLSVLLIYLEKEWGKSVADDLITKLDIRINSLQHHPFIGAQTKLPDVRGIYISSHNRMYYKVKGNKVIILNLYDTRKKNYG
jgi:plasmid stabilization system protein ParE